MVVLWEEKRLGFGESERNCLVVDTGMSGKGHCMGFVQSRWCLEYMFGNDVAENLGEWGSVEGRVGDNIEEKMEVVCWCQDDMGIYS
jgi:hypothetical protein